MNTVEALVSFVVTTFGVLLGLVLNGYISDRSDNGVYLAIVNSVQSEAKANKDTLIRSFNKFVSTKGGLVLNEFRVDVALNSLANPLFVRKTKPTEIQALNNYVRHLSHANNYARTARQFATANAPDVAERWDEPLRDAWKRNLKDCETSLNEILPAE
jgi:hypothetical protein